MKVAGTPKQDGFAEAAIATLTGIPRLGITIMEIVLEVAGLSVAQAAFDVKIQEIKSPSWGICVKTELFVPLLIPLTFH